MTLREAFEVARRVAPDAPPETPPTPVSVLTDALLVFAARLGDPCLPSVELLLDDRREARDLADNLAAMLDELHSLAVRESDDLLDSIEAAAELLQEWHERSWAP